MSPNRAKGIVALTAILVSLLAAEIFLRLFVPQQLIVLKQQEIWQPDEELGWQMKPNIDTFVNTGEGEVRLLTDAQGFRVGVPNPQPLGYPRGVRILVVGDSFVEGLGLPYESTLPRLLEVDVGRLLGAPVGVSSRAASGWNPYQYLSAVRRELQNHAYDLGLIFLYAANDVVGANSAIAGASARPERSLPVRLLQTLNDLLERRSHLFALLKTRGSVALARLGLTSAYFPAMFLKTFTTSHDWRSTVEVCQRIQTEFRRRNTPVIFVLLPAAYQVHPEIFENYLDAFGVERGSVDLEQPSQILSCAFAEASMTLLDPLHAMRAGASRGTVLFGRVDRHLNPSGSAVVSRFVAQQIAGILQQTNETAAQASAQ